MGGVALRGIWHRRGLSVAILVVASTAAGAAALGPAYHEAAATATARDVIADAAEVPGLILSANSNGFYDSPALDTRARQIFGTRAQLFQPAIPEWSFAGGPAGTQIRTDVVWREGTCEHLAMLDGRCPREVGEAAVSASVSGSMSWAVGAQTRLTGSDEDLGSQELMLTVVGVYRVIDPEDPFWFGLDYFPLTSGTGEVDREAPHYDTIFTTRETFESAGLTPRSATDGEMTVKAMLPLTVDRLAARDLDPLIEDLHWIRTMDVQGGVRVNTVISQALAEARKQVATLGVPFVLVAVQLVVLCWLLLFLVVTDVAEARGAEAALLKLRGLPRHRVVRFLLAEPVLLIGLALPTGVFLGWLSTRALARWTLGPTIPVEPGAASWVAASAAAAGGFVAAALASRRTLARSVVDQWRGASHRTGRRTWGIDVALGALAGLGLLQLVATDTLTTATRERALTLLTPGLTALAAAVLAARVLPLACRALLRPTRRRGSIAIFLALRQLARRPGGMRSTIALTMSFALVAFALSAWQVAKANHRTVAALELGAPVVLDVQPRPGISVAETVRGLDPAGNQATVVLVNPAPARGDATTLGVEPERFARFASWRADFAPQPLPVLLERLQVALPPPVSVAGTELRVAVEVRELVIDPAGPGPAPVQLLARFATPDRTGGVVRQLGVIERPGHFVWSVLLPGCEPSCELRQVYLSSTRGETRVTGDLLIKDIARRTDEGWVSVDAGLQAASRWRPHARGDSDHLISVTARAEGLQVRLRDHRLAAEPGVRSASVPQEVPVVAAGPVAVRNASLSGLDDKQLNFAPMGTAQTLPVAMGSGALVDLDLLRRSAFGVSDRVEQQVWTIPDAADDLRAGLERAGVRVIDERRVETLVAAHGRSGPGLALALLLAEAAAAAVLATGGVVLALYAAARRRTYELAALESAGIAPRSLRAALFAEQLLLLGFAALAGSLAGLAVARVALPVIPIFEDPPAAPLLDYVPELGLPAAVIGIALAGLLAAAWVTSNALMRQVGAERLREAPS